MQPFQKCALTLTLTLTLISTPYHSQEYDASGAPDQRLARRRHLVNAAAPQLTELFLEVRDGSLGGGGGDAAAWRRAAVRCAESEACETQSADSRF